MKNHKKGDDLSVNIITPGNEIRVTKKNAGNASKDPFCIYEHKRHAVGSKIMSSDGSEAVCKDDSSWHNN